MNILICNEHPVALTKLNSFQNRHSNSSKKDSEISVNFMLPKRTVSMFQKEHVSFLEAEMSFLAHLQITDSILKKIKCEILAPYSAMLYLI